MTRYVILVLAVGCLGGAPAPAPESAMAVDPPPRPGTVLPKKYGDEPPAPAPASRASRWTWFEQDGTRTAPVDCDHLAVPALAAASKALFTGTARTGEPPKGEAVLLDVVWLTDGAPSGRTRLYTGGARTTERDGVETIEAVLSPAELEAFWTAFAAAKLGDGPVCP